MKSRENLSKCCSRRKDKERHGVRFCVTQDAFAGGFSLENRRRSSSIDVTASSPRIVSACHGCLPRSVCIHLSIYLRGLAIPMLMLMLMLQQMDGEEIALVGAKAISEADGLQDLVNEVRIIRVHPPALAGISLTRAPRNGQLKPCVCRHLLAGRPRTIQIHEMIKYLFGLQ